jgi:epoxyqueuosine reductase
MSGAGHHRAERSEQRLSGYEPRRPVTPEGLREAFSGKGIARVGFVRARSADGVPDPEGDVSAAVVTVPYDTREGGEPDGAYARVGFFARRHTYDELIASLAELGALLAASTGIPARRFRAKANSRFPEKALAAAAGLGSVGKSSLIIDDALGPGVAIGALILPFTIDAPAVAPRPDFGRCGSCDACVRACPTGALDGRGGVDRERCLQAWATREGALPAKVERAWGRLFYGCDRCLAACPHFARDAHGRAAPIRGELGPWIECARFLSMDDDAARRFLAGTALGFRWVPLAALRRNASLAARPRL